jgi:hypothetical protein
MSLRIASKDVAVWIAAKDVSARNVTNASADVPVRKASTDAYERNATKTCL